MRLTRVVRVATLAVATLLLSACNVETVIGLSVEPNGSGEVTITVTADKDVVAQAPNLVTDFRSDDLKAVGWKVSGPRTNKNGSVSVSLRHHFDTPAQATSLLNTINADKGPLHEMALTRSGRDTSSKWNLSGRLEVNGGLEAFVDNKTLELLGGAPYATQLKQSGLDIGEAVTLRFTAALPGDVKDTTGLAEDGVLVWRIPMDGSVTQVATNTQNVDIASTISRVAKPILVGLLVLWVLGIGYLALRVNAVQKRRHTPLP